MNDWDVRDCVVEEVRYLMNGGYRHQETAQVEVGIDRLWDAKGWWATAIGLKLDDVITKLANDSEIPC